MKQYTHEDYLRLEAEFKEKEKSMEERLWIDSHVGKLDDLLRSNFNRPVAEFGSVVIEHLAQLTNAYHGVFYIVKHEEKTIEAVAGFACKVEKLPQQRFAFGEAIVGQTVVSREKVLFDNIQGNATQNISLVGQLRPQAALVMPLLFNEKAYGVVELVFINPLENRHALFLDRVGQNIAAMLESILNNARMQEILHELQHLLAESQEKEEKLRSQEEELRQNLEEMTATREAQENAQRELEHLKQHLEQKVAQQTQRLEDAVQKFDLAAQTTTEGLWDLVVPDDLTPKEDTYFWWSGKFRQMLGYKTEEEFPNRLDSWANLLHPDHKQATLDAFSAHLMDFSGQTPYDVTYQLRRHTGEYRWYRAVGNTLRDEQGKPLRVAGSLIDIQEKKELEAYQENFMLYSQVATDGFWYVELQASLDIVPETPFFWSEGFKRLLGYQPEDDFPPRMDSWWNRLHPDDSETTYQAMHAFLDDTTGKTLYNVTYRLLHRDGEYRWFGARAVAVRNQQGLPEKVAGNIFPTNPPAE